MVEPVVAEIEAASTTLVFTNTRSQAELWYQHILRLRPEWAGILAIHHGSLSRETRDWVEQGLKDGSLKAVVCTSSLDLGVDFLPVERVIQIGSPKGVARLLQRAGRSGHAPGRVSRITLVPTHTLELVEAAAVRDAVISEKDREPAQPQRAPGRARPALRDRRARRRLPARRSACAKCARPRPTSISRTKTGRGCSISSAAAVRASRPIPASAVSRPTRKACGAWPTGTSRCDTSSTSARSSATPPSWCNTGPLPEARSSARSRRASSRA